MDKTTKIVLYAVAGIIGMGVLYWLIKKLVALVILIFVLYLIYRLGFANTKAKS